MSIAAAPGVVAFGDTRITAGLLLVNRTLTPACSDPPSCPLNVPYCKPDPTVVGSENSEIPGAVTVMLCDASPSAMKPVAEAETTVVPPPIGSNSIPPPARVDGDDDCPGPIVTVRL